MFDEGNAFSGLILALIIGGVALVIIGTIILLALYQKKWKKENKTIVQTVSNDKWVNALGGKDNIVSLEAKGSRLIVKLNKNELLNKEELHNLGAVSIISGQDKTTLVLKEKAENIQNMLQ